MFINWADNEPTSDTVDNCKANQVPDVQKPLEQDWYRRRKLNWIAIIHHINDANIVDHFGNECLIESDWITSECGRFEEHCRWAKVCRQLSHFKSVRNVALHFVLNIVKLVRHLTGRNSEWFAFWNFNAILFLPTWLDTKWHLIELRRAAMVVLSAYNNYLLIVLTYIY